MLKASVSYFRLLYICKAKGQAFQEEWAIDDMGDRRIRLTVLSSSRGRDIADPEYHGVLDGKSLRFTYSKKGGWGSEDVEVGINVQAIDGESGLQDTRTVVKEKPCSVRYSVSAAKQIDVSCTCGSERKYWQSCQLQIKSLHR